jgi:hypothetical protein
MQYLRSKRKLVLKLITGSRGYGIKILSLQNDILTINSIETPVENLRILISSLKNYFATEFVTQGRFSSTLYPYSTNTLRILTMWDEKKSEPFIAFAVQRIGTSTSIPVDNFSQGGICARVDINTGEMYNGLKLNSKNKKVSYKRHPETEAQIKGAIIPNWREIKSDILKISRRIPFIPYVGWDIVITQDGFKILEGNYNPDPDVLQIHAPLLLDPRVRHFYKKYRII